MELTEEELDVMELAYLFRMPLYKMLDEMPYQEYIAWMAFLRQRPRGREEDYRAAAMISALQPKAPILKIFPNLAPQTPKKDGPAGELLQGSQMLQMLLNAKGGDKLGV